jgi:hypothetical protein
MHSSVVDCEFANCALIFCFFSHVGPPSNCRLGSDAARARQHLCKGHEGVPGDGVTDTHFVKQLLPPFQNIRCFSFVKQMYLDIF